jgi:hypothetical protein
MRLYLLLGYLRCSISLIAQGWGGLPAPPSFAAALSLSQCRAQSLMAAQLPGWVTGCTVVSFDADLAAAYHAQVVMPISYTLKEVHDITLELQTKVGTAARLAHLSRLCKMGLLSSHETQRTAPAGLDPSRTGPPWNQSRLLAVSCYYTGVTSIH